MTPEQSVLDLFRDIPEHAMTPEQRRLILGRKYPKNGYAAPPGTGPEGETCKTCDHCCKTGRPSKSFYKCGLLRAKWTHGYGTDIKVRSPACRKWERATNWETE